MHLHPSSTDERLLEAALELLAERGYRGATTRAIAERAGVAEVTLFRRFGSKARLLAEAVRRAGAAFEEAAARPSGDLRADLHALAGRYLGQLKRGGALIFVMAGEASREPELRRALEEALAGRLATVLAFFEHYQRRGELRPAPAGSLIHAFFGPLIAAALFGVALEGAPGLDVEAHVEGFLGGWAA
ncbi:TetR/AcrR family transcriptional regulator [Oceanithermus sp.]|uniref:TetR/AcrR family transcriptional regulator n=1 Tax=Oceanithermus sp. TaxID=2268145 RepID=UPI00257D3409|nr:TetR/AcrR family transcriptional regulator [Oceanithermus sp.]